MYRYATTPSPGNGSVLVQIPRGAGVRDIGAVLAEQRLLENDVRYLILVRLTGTGTRLQAGEFELQYGWTPLQVLRFLEQGKTYTRQLTIPEGLTLTDIAVLFAEHGWGSKEKLTDLAREKSFCLALGVEQASLEGYLFPDTYYLTRGEMRERDLLAMMVRRFHEVWSQLQVPEQFAFSQHEIVTLASMVEKETGTAAERPLISRVFINRLERGMRLQSDPTVIYGLKTFNGNLTRSDLRTPSPYNTYVVQGIPAGPICNPGRDALEAILLPAETDALYFVSRNDGRHHFSTTLKEHNRAVRKYQKKRKRAK